MNKIFNFRRFANYFIYDFRNAYRLSGFSILVFGLFPLIFFLLFEFFSLVFEGTFNFAEPIGTIAIVCSWCLSAMILPKKIYGSITDKRMGTEFLMIPASSFEKWFSMSLILCVIVPAINVLLLYISDNALYNFFPNYYGRISFENADIPDELNLTGLVIGGWISSVCTYNLGAIIFKKSKISKTILATMAVGVIITPLAALIDFDNIEKVFLDEQMVITYTKIFTDIIVVTTDVILLTAIYIRLKTIKH